MSKDRILVVDDEPDIRELLDIYTEAFGQEPGRKGLRWRIEHCQVIHPDDLLRFSELGVIASVRGVFATSDGPWVVNRLGEERARERGYQYQTLIQSGAVLVNGTDLYKRFDAFRTDLGYVPQDDIIHKELTAEKALNYVARLRLPALGGVARSGRASARPP